MKRGKEDAEGTEPHPVKRREKYKELHSPADMPCCGNRRFWQSVLSGGEIKRMLLRRCQNTEALLYWASVAIISEKRSGVLPS